MKRSTLHEIGVFSDETNSSFHAIIAQTASRWPNAGAKFWNETSFEPENDVKPLNLARTLALLLSHASTEQLVGLRGKDSHYMQLSPADRRFAEDVSFQPYIPCRCADGVILTKSLSQIATIVRDAGGESFCGIATYGAMTLLLLLSESTIVVCGPSYRLRTVLQDELYFELASLVASADATDSHSNSTP